MVEAVLVDTSNRYWDYPKPIAVTDPVLALMQDEFNRSDSLSLLFVEVSPANFKHLMQGEEVIDYCSRHDLVATLTALAVHCNPDVRIKALQARLTRARIGLLITCRNRSVAASGAMVRPDLRVRLSSFGSEVSIVPTRSDGKERLTPNGSK